MTLYANKSRLGGPRLRKKNLIYLLRRNIKTTAKRQIEFKEDRLIQNQTECPRRCLRILTSSNHENTSCFPYFVIGTRIP
jgi:hypothetical protein